MGNEQSLSSVPVLTMPVRLNGVYVIDIDYQIVHVTLKDLLQHLDEEHIKLAGPTRKNLKKEFGKKELKIMMIKDIKWVANEEDEQTYRYSSRASPFSPIVWEFNNMMMKGKYDFFIIFMRNDITYNKEVSALYEAQNKWIFKSKNGYNSLMFFFRVNTGKRVPGLKDHIEDAIQNL